MRSTRDQTAVQASIVKTMKTWNELRHYAGLDWAKDHHDVVVVDPEGTIVTEFGFEHSAKGWEKFRQSIKPFPHLGVVLETNHGIVVDQLLEAGCLVFAIHPKSAKHYRDRKIPSGNKTDRTDAWTMAEALRTDGRPWSPVSLEDEATQQIRLLCRDEIALIDQRTLLVNQLQQALRDYFPAALEAFDDWTLESTWDFLIQFPTPQALALAGKRRWEKFLHTHRMWREDGVARRLEIFARADRFCGSAPVVTTKSVLAVGLAKVLKTLQVQIKVYRQQIAQRFEQHPDSKIFDSLPGAGAKLAPRLLAELGTDRQRFIDAAGLQCLAGTAPISFESGQIKKVRVRYQCDKVLRYTVHLWADCSRKVCVWAQTYYQQKRKQGKSHACALRCLGQRWLKILWKMWNTRTAYDENLHTLNQQKHGSWVLTLKTEKIA